MKEKSDDESDNKLFLKLFPTEEQFENLLSILYSHTIKIVDDHINIPDKRNILSALQEDVLEICSIESRIENLRKFGRYEESKYTIISSTFIAKYKHKLELLHSQYASTSASEIQEVYYLKNPHQSWRQNPLGFYHYFVIKNGYDLFSSSPENYHQERDSIEILFDRYKEEFYKSREIIDGNISDAKTMKQKSAYLQNICEQLNYLYKTSNEHHKLNAFKDHLRPYISLARYLKKNYRDQKLKLSFPTKKASGYSSILQKPQVVTDLRVICYEKNGEEVFLFDKEEDNLYENISLFLEGQYANIKGRLSFMWDKQSLYYLFHKLKSNGTKIKYMDIQNNTSKFYFTKSGYSENAQSKTITELVKGNITLPGNAKEIIDSFFKE